MGPFTEDCDGMGGGRMKYQEKYCKKHGHWYAKFLDQCPICVGEKMKVAKKGKKVVSFLDKIR